MVHRIFVFAVLILSMSPQPAHADVLSDIATLKADVQAGVTNGDIPAGNGNTLVNILNGAAFRYQQGNFAATKSLLNSFKGYVNTWVNNGTITDPVEGQDWIDQANAIIAQIP